MRYVEAKLEIQRHDEAYRIYLTDALQTISENVSKLTGGQYMTKRFADVGQIETEKKTEPKQKIETRSAQQIATDMWVRMKGGGKNVT